ncbi:MAG TPA: very short patch repair endonuclease [Thermoanaerobaculia bacterium]|nr:very short patch repair endonuclease [Thermoanaerobaculia bacterium]
MSDNLTPEQRSYMMSRVRSKHTKPELIVRRALFARGLRFRLHDRALPGRPDLVFPRARVAVFIDGDFWHGWRFPLWSHKLAPYWRSKITRNRQRDVSNFRRLRRLGWHVIRVWEHQIEGSLDACLARIVVAVSHARYLVARPRSERSRREWARVQTTTRKNRAEPPPNFALQPTLPRGYSSSSATISRAGQRG